MSDELKKTLPRIRTFAADFEHDRKGSDTPLPPGVTAPKAAAPKPSVTPSEPIEIPASDEAPSIAITAHVPAFHEFKKRSVSDNITAPPHPPENSTVAIAKLAPETLKKTVVVRSQKLTTQKTTSAAGATIITDNKRAKQNLISALIESIRKWFKETSASSKQKRAPKYTVVDTQRRKGVIQKATTKTGTIFTADNETLKEEIRRRNLEHPQQATEPDITWSPNTEVGYPLLTGFSQPVNVAVEFKKRAAPEPIVVAAPIYTPAPVAVPPPVFVEPSVPEPAMVPPPTIVEPAKEVPPETPSPVEELEVEADYVLTTPEAHYRIKSIGDVTRLNTNLLSIGIVSAVAAVIIVVIVGKALIGIVFEATPQMTVQPATSLSIVGPVTDIALNIPTQEALIIALQQVPTTEQVKQEFRITDIDGTPLPKQVLLPLLGLSNTGSLSQTIDEVHILQNGTTRSIIFSVTDATTAFGSLLAWEGYMVDTLGPILNITRPAVTIAVSDRTIQNTDIRIFTADTTEVLVYGFVDANTVLITKDTPSFTAVLGSK
jgi:hypothetical protein